MAQHPDSAVLVETEWLAANTSDPGIRLVEVDEDTAAYEVAHIPGASAWHWQKDLHDPLRRDFIDANGLQELLTRSGVGDETTVILYGGNNNWFAAYAYWYLKYQGFDNVKLLNGGRKKWEQENRPMTAERPTVTPAATPPRLAGPRPNIRALREEVLAKQGAEAVFIDVRSPEEYRGELLAPPHLPQEQAQVPGHIPRRAQHSLGQGRRRGRHLQVPRRAEGALRVGRRYRGQADNRLLPDRRALLPHLVRPPRTVNYPDVKNYDGSWTEYGSLVGVPVER